MIDGVSLDQLRVFIAAADLLPVFHPLPLSCPFSFVLVAPASARRSLPPPRRRQHPRRSWPVT